MLRTLIATATSSLFASSAFAESWKLDADASHLAFGSVKNAYVGEVHSFGGLSGSAKDGQVEIKIDLASVQTNIDIRNERMGDHVFSGIAVATLTADVAMEELTSMSVGDSTVMEFDGNLSLLGEDVSLFTDVMVMRLTDEKVMVMTNDMVFLATDEAGIDAGIDTLQELASLDSITRATPITARFVFDLDA
jgi:hypothetical protein